MLQPTYGLRQKTAYSTAPIIRPPQNIPIMTRGSSLSLNQETVYQHLPNPAEESTIDPSSFHSLSEKSSATIRLLPRYSRPSSEYENIV